MVQGLRADLHGNEGTAEVFGREGLLLASRRHGMRRSRSDGTDDGRGVSNRLLDLSDGIVEDFIDGRLAEKSHHRAIVALGVDDSGRLRSRVGGAGGVDIDR